MFYEFFHIDFLKQIWIKSTQLSLRTKKLDKASCLRHRFCIFVDLRDLTLFGNVFYLFTIL